MTIVTNMPLYEYRCEKCQSIKEVVQKFSDPLLTECPDCQSPVTKLMSRSSFALKGSGWYTTDYKKASSPSAEKAAASNSTDAKPEAKAETGSTPTPKAPESSSSSGTSSST